MKELDVVELIKDFQGLPCGTKGTIVLEYDSGYYEVEFLMQTRTPSVYLLLQVNY